LPAKERFNSEGNYLATLFHELIHWTAKEERLPRECFKNYRMDSKARAEEELIAEIGSVFLAIHYGIKGELENQVLSILSPFCIFSINAPCLHVAATNNSLKLLILDAINPRRSARVLFFIRKLCRISSNAVQKIKAQKKLLKPFITL